MCLSVHNTPGGQDTSQCCVKNACQERWVGPGSSGVGQADADCRESGGRMGRERMGVPQGQMWSGGIEGGGEGPDAESREWHEAGRGAVGRVEWWQPRVAGPHVKQGEVVVHSRMQSGGSAGW